MKWHMDSTFSTWWNYMDLSSVFDANTQTMISLLHRKRFKVWLYNLASKPISYIQYGDPRGEGHINDEEE